MKKTRIEALFLAAAMIVPTILSGCGNTAADTDTTSGEGSVSSSDETTSRYRDSLGEYDFGGEDFTVLCRETQNGQFFDEVAVDEESGDLVDDAVYKRNAEIGARFNVNIVANKANGSWPDRESFNSLLKTSVMAGDGAFDLVLGYQAYSANLDVAECLYDFMKVPVIDLDAEYYYHDIIDEITVNGKLFYLVGDYTYSVWPSLFVYYFNKQIAEDNGIDGLYDLVREGKWTVDKLSELCAGVYRDLNGNSEKDEEDMFGLATDYENVADAYYSAFQVRITDRGEDGMPRINTDIARMEEVVTKLSALYDNNDGVYAFRTHSSMTTNPLTEMFVEDRALFYPDMLRSAISFRSMETDFGVLPYPKYEESQDKYFTQPHNGYSVMMIPADVKNIEKTAVMVEALNAASLDSVIPAFYDKALKVKFTRDEDSAEMLDIIRDGICFQFGYYYTVTLNEGATDWRIRDVLALKKNVASTFAACERRLGSNLEKILDFYRE